VDLDGLVPIDDSNASRCMSLPPAGPQVRIRLYLEYSYAQHAYRYMHMSVWIYTCRYVYMDAYFFEIYAYICMSYIGIYVVNEDTTWIRIE